MVCEINFTEINSVVRIHVKRNSVFTPLTSITSDLFKGSHKVLVGNNIFFYKTLSCHKILVWNNVFLCKIN